MDAYIYIYTHTYVIYDMYICLHIYTSDTYMICIYLQIVLNGEKILSERHFSQRVALNLKKEGKMRLYIESLGS